MAEESKPPEGSKAEPDTAPAQAKKPVARKPPPPKKPTVMETSPWEGEAPERLRERFGEAIRELATYRGQNFLVAGLGKVREIVEFLKQEEAFDYLVDLTAVDDPKREKRFELVWILYSFDKNERLRIKALCAEEESAPSVTGLYSAANWAEREVFDMFGIRFEGHPDLRRILLPDEWSGYPLRKDYGIVEQDQDWVRQNLAIESAQ